MPRKHTINPPRICPECGREFTAPYPSTRKSACSISCASKRKGGISRPRAPRPLRPIAERFLPRVDRSGACWLWTGPRHPNGYGRFNEYGKGRAAHRVAYELAFGPIPEGAQVNHSCDVRLCVNPDHLWTGSQQNNMDDMMRKGRGNPPRGDACVRAKLSAQDVREIRDLFALRVLNQGQLAARFGVKIRQITRICCRVSWAHV